MTVLLDDKLLRLQEALAMASDARSMASTSIWSEAWDRSERQFVERLLKCGPTDDVPRYRLQTAIEVCRQVRGFIEHAGQTAGGLEKEISQLEGRVVRPIA
jgi:hypothetical protein